MISAAYLQLVVYLNAGMQLISQRYEGDRVIPAGIFYYHIDDPVIQEEGQAGDDTGKINDKILEKFRMSGLVNSDETVYRLMDNDFSGRSRIIPVSTNKDGSFGRGSSVANEEEFGIISSYVNQKIAETGKEILEGNIKAEPHMVKKGDNLPCDYCDYKDVCTYRGDGVSLAPDDKKEVIELMRIKTENEG